MRRSARPWNVRGDSLSAALEEARLLDGRLRRQLVRPRIRGDAEAEVANEMRAVAGLADVEAPAEKLGKVRALRRQPSREVPLNELDGFGCDGQRRRSVRGGPVSEPPVTKYELTVKIRGNTHDEIEDELLTLVHGGYLLDSDYGKRDAWNATSGRCTSVMVHTNPEQTPERYRDELDAWWNERRAARREAQR
jgi:hypothetical protein